MKVLDYTIAVMADKIYAESQWLKNNLPSEDAELLNDPDSDYGYNGYNFHLQSNGFIFTGDISYWCGGSPIVGQIMVNAKVTRKESRILARDILEQAQDNLAELEN